VFLVIGIASFIGLSRLNHNDSAKFPAQAHAVPREITEREHPEQFLEITKFSWTTEGFGSFMVADFTIKNSSAHDIKDITVRCTHAAPSGTVIDSNERTIYEVVQSNKTRSFRKFHMGFIHSQAKSSGCKIVSASLL
jgi:hypothetical protein